MSDDEAQTSKMAEIMIRHLGGDNARIVRRLAEEWDGKGLPPLLSKAEGFRDHSQWISDVLAAFGQGWKNDPTIAKAVYDHLGIPWSE